MSFRADKGSHTEKTEMAASPQPRDKQSRDPPLTSVQRKSATEAPDCHPRLGKPLMTVPKRKGFRSLRLNRRYAKRHPCREGTQDEETGNESRQLEHPKAPLQCLVLETSGRKNTITVGKGPWNCPCLYVLELPLFSCFGSSHALELPFFSHVLKLPLFSCFGSCPLIQVGTPAISLRAAEKDLRTKAHSALSCSQDSATCPLSCASLYADFTSVLQHRTWLVIMRGKSKERF